MTPRRSSTTVVILLMASALVVSASRADAPAGRFTVSAGTVYDTKTRLTWQQTLDVNSYTWAQAGTYCAGRGPGWRLPTIGELQTIVDESRAGNVIDRTAFPNSPPTWTWSGTAAAGSPTSAWLVDFTNGTAFWRLDNKTTTNRVRCVR
jgi:hypothetical protein